jgi:probable phosphoglycerate mutase
MSGDLVVVRHADTDWTVTGQHTGLTDLGLNDAGRAAVTKIARRLAGRTFAEVWCSPLRRARETCELAGYEPETVLDLREWNYGNYEGLTTAEIQQTRPGWDLWADGAPNGEQAVDVGARADAVLAMLPAQGDVIVFSHGHFLRVLIARWMGLPPTDGAVVLLAPGAIGVLGHEHGRRVLRALG